MAPRAIGGDGEAHDWLFFLGYIDNNNTNCSTTTMSIEVINNMVVIGYYCTACSSVLLLRANKGRRAIVIVKGKMSKPELGVAGRLKQSQVT